MADCGHWTFLGLSFLLLAMTELTALASSYHLSGEEKYPDSSSRYGVALQDDIGNTLNLLSYLLDEKDDELQDNKQSTSHLRSNKDVTHSASEKEILQSLSDLNQNQERRKILATLLQNSQLKTLLKSYENGKDIADDAKGNEGGDGRSQALGLESLLRTNPVSLSASTQTDDVIPAVSQSKRGRQEQYGAMPPTYELCRMMGVRCY